QPPRPASVGIYFGTPHQVALADDSNQFSVAGDDRDSADPILEQSFSDLFDQGLRSHSNDRRDHDIGGLHSATSVAVRRLILSHRPYQRTHRGHPGTAQSQQSGIWQN